MKEPEHDEPHKTPELNGGTTNKGHLRKKAKLRRLLDFRSYTPELLASIGVGNEADIAFLVLLPLALGWWGVATVLERNPSIAQHFPAVLGDDGTFSRAEFWKGLLELTCRNLEAALHERAQGNSPLARRLLAYASQANPPDELVRPVIPKVRKALGRFSDLTRYGMDSEDALQTALLRLLEDLEPLRQSKERLYEAWLSTDLNYVGRVARNRLIDQIRRTQAQKRNPKGTVELPVVEEERAASAGVLRSFPRPQSVEEVVVQEDFAAKVVEMIGVAFPGMPRL